MKNARRIFILTIAALILFSFAFSVFHIGANPSHDCCGEGCTVCCCLCTLSHLLHGISTAFFTVYAVLPLCSSRIFVGFQTDVRRTDGSLISLRTKLSE